MSTLSTLQSKVTDSLGTAVTTYFTPDKKTTALNWATKYILLKYEVPEFIREVTLTFTGGKASIPSDYLRYTKLYDPSNPDSTIYTRVDINKFDKDMSQTWTKKYSEDDSSQMFWIYPSSVTSATLRYLLERTEMEAQTDESGYGEEWDEALATFATYKLLYDRKDFNDAQAKRIEAEEYIRILLQHKNQENELRPISVDSYYNENSLLGNPSRLIDVE